MNQLKNGCAQRRIGLRMQNSGCPPARPDTPIYSANTISEERIGHITSGCPSPSLGQPIAMGYVMDIWRKSGTAVQLKIRNKMYAATVVRMPFVATKYYLQK